MALDCNWSLKLWLQPVFVFMLKNSLINNKKHPEMLCSGLAPCRALTNTEVQVQLMPLPQHRRWRRMQSDIICDEPDHSTQAYFHRALVADIVAAARNSSCSLYARTTQLAQWRMAGQYGQVDCAGTLASDQCRQF